MYASTTCKVTMRFVLEIRDEKLLSHLRWNSYLSDRYKLLYIATPKVACTSLKWWFAALEGYSKDLSTATDSSESSPELVIHDVFHKIAPNVTGLAPEALAEALTSDAYFRFAVVRNPYKRIFSAWQSKLLLREPLQIRPYLKCDFFYITVENKDDVARAFEAFLEHLVSREAPHYWDVHWTPQAMLLRPDLISYSKLVQIEHAQELSAALAEHLGPEIPDPFAARSFNESLIPYLPEFITEKSEELIRFLYAQDFDLFGYAHQKPAAKEKFSVEQLGIALRAVNLIRGRHQRMAEIRSDYDRRIVAVNQVVAEHDVRIAELVQSVTERNVRIAELVQSVTERDVRIAERDVRIAERDVRITELNRAIAVRNNQIAGLDQAIAERNGRIAVLNQSMIERESVIAGLHQSMAAVRTTETDKDRQIHELSRVVERLKDSDARIAEILNSKSWRLTEPFRAFRRCLPYRMQKQTAGPVNGGSALPQSATGGFPLGVPHEIAAQAGADFDADFYCKAYPDIHGQDPYVHYIRHGKKEGRLPCAPGLLEVDGLEKLDRSRETVLIVSHEASRSGAPILALNIAEHFHSRYNVIALSLRGGDLMADFQDKCDIVLQPFPQAYNPYIVSAVLANLLPRLGIKFAVVNSIVSRAVLPVLARCFIPSLCLVHEFASYTHPRNAIREVLLWASQVVFSARIVYENNAVQCEELKKSRTVILPQGRCKVPAKQELEVDDHRRLEIRKLLRPASLPENTVVILGAGAVQLRKGVDLFLACAARVVSLHPENPFRFVWVGNGFNPDVDMVYSVYLQDQITRAGLEDHVCFAGEIPEIDLAYQFSDILFLSSRLDPLPNVAIDAMTFRLPVVCFDNTTGIADLLKENGLGEDCVIPYLDIEMAASRLVSLIDDADQRIALGENCEKIGEKLFDMESYVGSLERQAQECVASQKTEKFECSVIEEDGSFDLDFYSPPAWPVLNRSEAVRVFVRSWASGVDRRKPFPGFHPGIYADHQGISLSNVNPLAAYIEAGKPEGPWLCELIQPSSRGTGGNIQSLRAALHLHVFFVELFTDILDRLELQNLDLDLLISVPSAEVAEQVGAATGGYTKGSVDIRIVPNRGRDIGPLLTEFSKTILNNYDVIGHVHTKKSGDVKDSTMGKTWFKFLLENLIGEEFPMATIILDKFAENQSIGLVFPDDPWVVGWSGNNKIAEGLARRFDILELPERHFNFPLGTMFWARTEALKPLFTEQLSWEDYPEEPLPYDGTLLHAIERLLPFVAQKTGYRLAMTNVPGITR